MIAHSFIMDCQNKYVKEDKKGWYYTISRVNQNCKYSGSIPPVIPKNENDMKFGRFIGIKLKFDIIYLKKVYLERKRRNKKHLG